MSRRVHFYRFSLTAMYIGVLKNIFFISLKYSNSNRIRFYSFTTHGMWRSEYSTQKRWTQAKEINSKELG